ncbi:hypothetical protein EJ05DRAFT_63661 [Pseudovirgaria hyperparasitica]|uniref:UROD/MetE-like protein n=1 Tax=Pseudovirgaria hyperparasitica TaxID=470096 RepID=A0A6A6W1G7_9PEZI|nr:uncharacterized protein EJ05DRAFT_63661 [Pseudovirgaria hyperparasitica]KAF2756375.1 hypothetical protein EJ05DRAFT_63661 [Pseudovirgaria hyperparasitica]
MTQVHPVLLLGSSPYTSTSEAITRFCKALPTLSRVSDGETNERSCFTLWQRRVFPPEILTNRFMPDTPQIHDPDFVLTFESLKPTGYADAALTSYPIFCSLRAQGIVPSHARFQVCLPSPINAVLAWVREPYMALAEKLYMRLILTDLAKIQHAIPPHDLCIQWDIPQEIAHMEHTYNPPRAGGFGWDVMLPWYDDVREHICAELRVLGDAVHEDAELGFHLCYGDFGGVHCVEPLDAGILVEVINGIAANVARRVSYYHIPVPRNRVDAGYFEPLRMLSMRARESTLFLGLVHAHDEEGTRERIETAKRVLGHAEFGISTECGLGRAKAENLASIFKICRRCSVSRSEAHIRL